MGDFMVDCLLTERKCYDVQEQGPRILSSDVLGQRCHIVAGCNFYSPVELSGPSVSSQQEKGLCVILVCFFEMLMWIPTKTFNFVKLSWNF